MPAYCKFIGLETSLRGSRQDWAADWGWGQGPKGMRHGGTGARGTEHWSLRWACWVTCADGAIRIWRWDGELRLRFRRL